jgi:hypothetical protein
VDAGSAHSAVNADARPMSVRPDWRFDDDVHRQRRSTVGDVVALHLGAAGPGRPRSVDPVSPELALVDADLAATLRSQLLPPWAKAPGWPVDEPPLEPHVDAPPEEGEGDGRESPAAAGAEAQTSTFEAEAPSATNGRRTGSSVSAVAAVGLALASALLGAAAAVGLMSAADEPRDGLGAAVSVERTVSTRPPAVAQRPKRPSPAPIVRTLAWAPVAEAGSYEIQLFRGAQRVFLQRKRATRIVIGPSWRYSGEMFRLVPGTYRWYVWPVDASGERRKEPLVQALVKIARS